MQAIQFETTMTSEGQIAVPADCAAGIPAGQHLKVVVMWESDDALWQANGRLRFEQAYAEEDSVYEQLLHDTPSR